MAGAHMLPDHHGKPFAFSNVGLGVAYEHPLHSHLVVGGKANAHFLLILPGTMDDGSNYIDSLNDLQVTIKGRIPLCGICKGFALGYLGAGLGPVAAFLDITGEEGDFLKWFVGIASDAELGVEVFPLSWMGLLVDTGVKVWGLFTAGGGKDYFMTWNSGIGLIFNL
ncbi:MAG: hypothetical protein AAF320_02070 [Myxococcota bacterium]